MRGQTTGSFHVSSISSGEDVTPRGRKARALLAYLISHPGTKIPKDRVTGLLWGDRGDAQARASLRQVIVELRRALNAGEPIFFTDREHIWISSHRLTEVETENSSAEPRDAFEDLDHVTPEFDEWLCAERSRRTVTRIEKLKSEAEELLASGRAAEATGVIDRIQAMDPLDEDAVRLGMRAEYECGRRAGIAKRFNAVVETLEAELGVEPSGETRALRDELLNPSTLINRASETKFCTLYERAERGLQIGAWDDDLTAGQLCWTPGMYHLFGLPVGSRIRREDVLEQFEECSRERLKVVREQALRLGTGFSIEVDISTPAGLRKSLWIDAKIDSEGGAARRVFGIMREIS